MSVKQKGPSRIPKFGTRILVRNQREKDSEKNHPIEKHMHILNETQIRPEKEEIRILNNTVIKSNRELKPTDLGRRVRLNNKEGVLRFLGNVHFAPGLWAGVEVSKGLGKNDGHVRGFRYFACPDDCGLLASVSKVSLIEDDEEASGPHSMIFGVNQENIMEAENGIVRGIINCDKTSLALSQLSSKTQCFEERCDEAKEQSFNISCKNEDGCRTFLLHQNCEISETIEKKPEDKNCTFVSQRTFVKEENATFCKQDDINTTFPKQHCDRAENTSCEYDPNNSTLTKQEPLNSTFNKVERKGILRDLTVDIPNSTYSNESVEEREELLNNNVDGSLDETLKPMNEVIKKRPFLLENLMDYSSPSIRYSFFNCIPHSTPTHCDFEPASWKSRLSPSHLEDESSKRDSLEFEESLGILTPDQMIDATGFVGSRTPSSENIRDFIKFQTNDVSPKIESSVNDFSLGIIDEHVLALNTKFDIVMDLDLREDPKNRILNRIEQTPSPEDLPLDPPPIQKIDQQKKTTSSFITSITSITSLDTGYQGDGEMSRPASRADENSALTRRQPRRPDPMTDSDFYTESDADNHDDNQTRGDRKAQVIDGTLYGVDPQAAADIYANNRENMDSSGIFTDIETRTEELQNLSPSDSSTKTLSDDSQTNVNLITNKTPTIETFLNENNIDTSNLETPSPVSTVASGPTSSKTSKSKDDTPIKKYKMPKRNVASKVKAMLEPSNKENEKKPNPVKKPAGRWDAVMNKISKTSDPKNLKEVKSKVFTSHPPLNVQRNNDVNKLTVSNKSPNNKIRKVRSRATTNVSSNKNAESINSSLSDLSGASPAKKNATTKKQREVVRVNQVLTSSKLPTKLLPKPNNHAANTEAKNKNNTNLNNEVKAAANRNLFSSKDKKKDVTKEIGRATVKGGRVSPGTRPPPQARAPQKPAPRTAEALAVLVQHLVFNLEAFKNPSLKKEVDRMRLDAEETRLSCRLLEETLTEEKQRHIENINGERVKYRAEIGQLIEKHRNELIQLNIEQQEIIKSHQHDKNKMRDSLMKSQEDKIRTFKVEYEKLQKTHEESLDILREENDAIREEIDEKNLQIRELEAYRCENAKLRRDHELKEISYKERLALANEEIARLREENDAFYNSQNFSSDNSLQEVHSLRAVLELKQSEFGDLRKALAEATQKADLLPAAEEKISLLLAKCEDMQHQLERKNDYELQIIAENKKLNESLKEEMNQKSRILQHNEELQWKLQQNKEVVSKVLEEASVSSPLSRSILSASFNERTLSFRERSLSNKSNGSQCRKSKTSLEIDVDELSPPSSPVVKGVVKKSDSVSYVLEMDESPEIVASRIVRRSFRNTPTKSPANKRQKVKNPLSLSSSTSALVRSDGAHEEIFWDNQVTSSPNPHKYYGDFDEDLVDITLPALPSEIGRKLGNTLPVPKHLAGEAMISESNSEDECSTSSSSGQL